MKRLVALPLLLLGWACGSDHSSDPGRWGGPDLNLEHSLWLEVHGEGFLGRGVVRRRGDRLDLLLLAPTGQRLWTLEVRGPLVRVETAVPALERLDPTRLLDDVRWSLFEGCPATLPGPEVRCRVGGIAVREVRDPQGRLSLREVRRPGSTARIEFRDWSAETGCPWLPRLVRFQNSTWDYRWEMGVERCRTSSPNP